MLMGKCPSMEHYRVLQQQGWGRLYLWDRRTCTPGASMYRRKLTNMSRLEAMRCWREETYLFLGYSIQEARSTLARRSSLRR